MMEAEGLDMARKGLPAKYAKMGFKKGWKAYKASKKSKSSNPRPKTKARKVRRNMAKKKRRRSRSMTIPLAPIIGLASGLALPAQEIIAGRIESGMDIALANFTGFSKDGSFNMERLKRGLLPVIAGLLVHKFVGGAPLNLNRVLAASKVPFIRI